MSGEFREVHGHSFLWDVLDNIEDEGGHEISQALAELYLALAPVEKGCAWHEAHDSSAARPAIALQQSWDRIRDAHRDLRRIYLRDNELIAAILEGRDQ